MVSPLNSSKDIIKIVPWLKDHFLILTCLKSRCVLGLTSIFDIMQPGELWHPSIIGEILNYVVEEQHPNKCISWRCRGCLRRRVSTFSPPANSVGFDHDYRCGGILERCLGWVSAVFLPSLTLCLPHLIHTALCPGPEAGPNLLKLRSPAPPDPPPPTRPSLPYSL